MMKCEQTKNLLPVYMDDELQPQESQEVSKHLADCTSCQKELKALQETWQALDQWPAIEPSPNYISRFWTELASRKSWHESILQGIRETVLSKKLIPALATVCIIAIVCVLSLRNYEQIQIATDEATEVVASLDEEELEMLEFMELAENYDLIENLEFIESLEILEELDLEKILQKT